VLSNPSNPIDFLYSNATLHWIPDHHHLFPHLFKQVRSGGVFSVQLPKNFESPSHRLVHDALNGEEKWRNDAELQKVISDQPETPPEAKEFYHILADYASHIDIWETEYIQVLSGPRLTAAHHTSSSTSPPVFHPVLEFVKGSYVAPILTALRTPEDKFLFQKSYSNLLEKAYPILPNPNDPDTIVTLFPFRRVFIIAVRK